MNIHFVKYLKPAKRYARALFNSSKEFSRQEVFENLKFVFDTINENAELKAFLDNPVVSKADKKDVIGQIFSNRIIAPVLNFLNLLIEANKLNILECTIFCFEDEINVINNVVKAQIISAINLNDLQKENIKTKLEQKTGKTILPEYITDEGILGGLTIKINDTVIDLSLKKKIDNLKNLIER